MKKHNREILKRVIPLVLAAVMVFGTLVSVIGTIVASAAPICPIKIEKVEFLSGGKTPTLNPSPQLYYNLRITVTVNTNASETKDSKYHMTDDEWNGIYSELYYEYAKPGLDPDDISEGTKKILSKIKSKMNLAKFEPEISLSLPLDEFDTKYVLPDKQLELERVAYIPYISEYDSCKSVYKSLVYEVKGDVPLKMKNETLNRVEVYVENKLDSKKSTPISITLKDNNNNNDVDDDSSSSDTGSGSGVTQLTPGSGSNNDDDDDDDKSSSSEPEKAQTTPKVIITGFDAPEQVNPGDEFDVTIRFRNNSQKKKMENITITIVPPEGVSICNDTNKKHYIQIPKRQIADDTFHLKASKDLKLEAVPITFKFEFQYLVNGEYKDGSSEEIVSIGAIPKEEEKEEDEKKDTGTEGAISSFEILSVIPPADLYPNEEGYLTVNVINKDHQYDASNVQLSVTGEGLASNGNVVYHGALAHSSLAEIEMPIQFTAPGTYTLEAIVTYEDAEGFTEDNKPIVRINDVKREFTVTVNESPDQMGGGMDSGMDTFPDIGGEDAYDDSGMPVLGGIFSGNMKYWIIGGGAAGGLLIIILVVQLVRRAKRKKEEDDENL